MSRANGWAVEAFTWGWNTIVLGILLNFYFKLDLSAAWLTRLLPLRSTVRSTRNVLGLQTRDKRPLCGASRKWRGIDNHRYPRPRKENTCLSIPLVTVYYAVSVTNRWQWLFNISSLMRWNKKQVSVHFYSPDFYGGISVLESMRPLSFFIIYVRLWGFFSPLLESIYFDI